MMSMMSMLKSKPQRPLNNEKGLEIMEAGLYAALVILASLLIMVTIGPRLAGVWTQINAAI